MTQRLRLAVALGVAAACAVAVLGTLAALTDEPFVFPSLGATIYLWLSAPSTPAASVRSTLVGHYVGAAAGLGALTLFGLRTQGPDAPAQIGVARVAAVALALGVTTLVMVALHAGHPPAGATTLIVSLGLLHTAEQLAILVVAVAFVVLMMLAVTRSILPRAASLGDSRAVSSVG